MKPRSQNRAAACASALAVLFAAAAIQKSAANTANWIGNPGVTATTNWSDNANWNNVGGGGAGVNGNDVRFGGTGSAGAAGTVTSVVDTMAVGANHPLSLAFTNGPGQFHTVQIPAGIILTNDNALTVGGLTADAYTTVAAMSGPGTLVQNGATATVQNYGSTVSTALATLDLSGLSNFVCTASAGTINVGSTGGNRSAGAFNLAGASNNLTVGTINLGTGSGANAATSNLRLGGGTNIINVGTFNVVNNKNSATVSFLVAGGGLRLRGVGGNDADRAAFTIANRNQTGTGTASGTVSFNGSRVDIKAGNLIVGQNSAASSVNTGSGVINFDTGILDATNIQMAVCSNPGAAAAATGTITVGANATLMVGAGGLSLVNRTGASATGTGNLNINGGAVVCSNSIVKTTGAGSTGNLTMSAGSLTMASGKTVGTAAIPLDNVNLTSATLNISVVANSTNIAAAALNLVDDANTVNVAALPVLTGYPSQFPIASYTSFPGGGSMNVGTLPSTYTGYISNDTVSIVWLVITNGPSTSKIVEWGGGVNNLWNIGSLNWTNAAVAVAYAEGDSVIFDDLAQTGTVSLPAARAPLAVLVTNNSLNYTFTGAGAITGAAGLNKQGNATLKLAQSGGDNFSGGVTVGGGTLILDDTNCAISGGVNIAGGATLQIGVNDVNGALPSGSVQDDGALIFSRTNNVAVSTAINGAGSLSSTGAGGKLTLTANNNYAGNTLVANGTLALSGAGAIASSAEVACSNATLDVSAATNAQTVLNNLNLTNSIVIVASTNVTTLVSVVNLGMGGAGNTINVGALPPIASYPTSIKLVQSANTISGFNMVLGTLPAASPAYSGTVTQSGDGLSVVLTLTAGPVGQRANVTWSGVDALANVNTNWSDRLNWQLPGAPGAADSVIFNNTATQSASSLSTPGGGAAALVADNINNFVNTSFTVSSLTFTNTGGSYHNTALTNGATLTVTNIFTVGAIDTTNTAQTEFVNISGTRATLNVNNTNSNLQVWLGTGSAVTSQATLDLSALDNFSANISRLTVGASAVNNLVNRPGGILYLAKTNTITCAFQTATAESGTTTGNGGIVIGDCNQNNGPADFVYLGQVNVIAADTIGIARQKTTGTLMFNPIYSNAVPVPSVTIGGFSSALVSIFSVGDAVGNTGTSTGSGFVNFNGGRVTANIDTMNIGRASGGTTGTSSGVSTGTVDFDDGTMTVNTLNVGLQPSGTGLKTGAGTFNVNTNTTLGQNATLVVNSNLNLASSTSGTGAAATTGTLSVNGGTVRANNIVAGGNSSTSTINLNAGTLAVSNVAGTVTAPITALNLNGGILQLKADGTATAAALVSANITASVTTTVNIGQAVNVSGTNTIPLIGYTGGSNPFGSLTLGSVPAGFAAELVDNSGNSTVDLKIYATVNPNPTTITASVSGNVLTLTWPADHTGWRLQVQTNSVANGLRSNWSDVSGSASVNSVNFSINPANGSVFYRMVYP